MPNLTLIITAHDTATLAPFWELCAQHEGSTPGVHLDANGIVLQVDLPLEVPERRRTLVERFTDPAVSGFAPRDEGPETGNPPTGDRVDVHADPPADPPADSDTPVSAPSSDRADDQPDVTTWTATVTTAAPLDGVDDQPDPEPATLPELVQDAAELVDQLLEVDEDEQQPTADGDEDLVDEPEQVVTRGHTGVEVTDEEPVEDVDELVRRTHAELPDPGFTGTRGAAPDEPPADVEEVIDVDTARTLGNDTIDALNEIDEKTPAEPDDPDPAPDVEPEPERDPAVGVEDPAPNDEPGDVDVDVQVEVVPCPLGPGYAMTDRCVALLDANPGVLFSAADVADHLAVPAARRKSVGVTLANLVKANRIRRPETGWHTSLADAAPAEEAPPVNEPLHRKVLRLLQSTGDVWDFDDLHDQIDSTNKELMDALKLLKGTGEAVKIARGRYQAAG